jgi:hypothetical protein
MSFAMVQSSMESTKSILCSANGLGQRFALTAANYNKIE